MLPVQETLSSQQAAPSAAQSKPAETGAQSSKKEAAQANAKVTFVVKNTTLHGAELISSKRYFPDFQSAEKQAKLSQYNRIDCMLKVAEQSFITTLTNSHVISPAIQKTITRLTLNSEGGSTITNMTSDYPNITYLYVQNIHPGDFSKLHLFKELSSLVIDDTSRKEAAKRFSQIFKLPDISDQALEFLPKCLKLTRLTLINVETVSMTALSQLKQKMPQLQVLVDLHSCQAASLATALLQPTADADVCFIAAHDTYKDGHLSCSTKSTRCYEPLNITPDTVKGDILVKIKTALSSHQGVIINHQKRKELDMLQLRSCTIDHDGPYNGVSSVLKPLKNAPKLQNLIMCKATKLDLDQAIKALPQHIQTLIINNSQLKKSDEISVSSGFKTGSIIDDACLFELLKMPNIKKISLIDCDGIKDHMIEYANKTKEGALTVERLTEMPQAERAPEKVDGKAEKNEIATSTSVPAFVCGVKRKAENGAASDSNPQDAKRAKTDVIEID